MAIPKILTGKIGLIIGLSFLILILLVAKTVFRQSKPTASPLPSTPHLVLPSSSPAPIEKSQRGDPTYWQEINKKLNQRFPLIDYLPYQNDEFTLDYLGPLKLEVHLKIASESAQAAVRDWIRSKGVDPATHEIIFK